MNIARANPKHREIHKAAGELVKQWKADEEKAQAAA
jgi:hypothetical protein